MATRMQCKTWNMSKKTHKPAYIKSCIHLIIVPASVIHLRQQQFTKIWKIIKNYKKLVLILRSKYMFLSKTHL